MKLLNRNQAIIALCKDKSVLHIGCVGFTDLTKEERVKLLPRTLHAQIFKVARKLTGLDYSQEVIQEVEKVQGFDNIRYANAEKLGELDLNETFDIIVVGDLIEHLSNPGQMLDGLKRFCTSNSNILLTTPNAFGVASFFRFLFNKFSEGDEHVMSFNVLNLQNMLERHGYTAVSINTCYQEHARKMVLFSVLKLLLSAMPKFGGTLFLEVKLDNS